MGHPSKNIDDSGAEGDLNCGDLAQAVTEDNVSMWPREGSCDILGRT